MNKLHGVLRLSIHHVGARGETQGLPLFESFERDITNVLYDADKNCVKEIEFINKNREAEIIILPYCLGKESNMREFYHMVRPYANSLLRPSDSIGELYVTYSDYDHTLKEAIRIKRTDLLSTRTLDSVHESEPGIPRPDFLSLDTQGSELEIFLGARRSFEGIVGIISEVEFVELYENQPLFGDVCQFLIASGFVLADLSPGLSGNYRAGPIGLRGNAFKVTCDATFLRDPTHLAGSVQDRGKASVQLYKLAFFSVALGFMEHALWALDTIRDIDPQFAPELMTGAQDCLWVKFMEKLQALIVDFPDYRFATFSQRHDPAERRKTTENYVDIRNHKLEIEAASEEVCRLLDEYGLSLSAESLRLQSGSDFERLSRSSLLPD